MTVEADGLFAEGEPVHALKRAIASGRTILVIGDLCSQIDGRRVGTNALRSALIRIATKGAQDDDVSARLDEALQAAKREDHKAVIDALKDAADFTAEVSEFYRRLFQGPWERIYNLAPIDLPQILEKIPSSGGISYVDARTDFRVEHNKNQLVDFCGFRSSAGVDQEFSVPNGSGMGPADHWYRQFAADVVSRPVLILATESNNDLWMFVRSRTVTESNGTMSPGFFCFEQRSFTDTLRAGNHSIASIDLPFSDLDRTCLASNIQEVSDGHRMLTRIRNGQDLRVGAQLVTNFLRRQETPSWEFLRGHDPSWGDISADRTVRLSRLSRLYQSLSTEKGRRNFVLLKGRSGSGKTTLLMRLAFELETKGLVVAWIDRSASDRVSDIVKQVESLAPDAVLIDDLDIFGDSSADFVRRLNRSGRTLVVATVRTTRLWAIEKPPNADIVDGDADLSDKDLKSLLEKLRDAGLLGELNRTAEPDRVHRLRELSKRDLLAALIQIVTGQPFEARIQSEYDQLDPPEQHAYSLICFGASRVYEASYLPEQDLLQMLTPAPPYGNFIVHIEALVDSRLIVRDPLGLRVRHRAIADAVVKSFDHKKMAEMVLVMLVFYAGRAVHIKDPTHPDRRQLIHLLSHSHMVDLRLGPDFVRPIYEKVQPLLSRDFHFWLQRGAFEVERGDLDLADSYLESARACEGGDLDFKVITEWGFMRLKKARRNADDRLEQTKAIRAVGELEQIARREGARSPHTFTILIRHGTEWLQDSRVLGDAERQKIAIRIRDMLQLGSAVVRDNRDFARAANEMKGKIEALASGDDEPFAFPLM
ncbi:ATP-binding cassette domain-containing protein [Actinoplanes xinjiangensis]|uniref:AAA+ ATPase domain-containing protein n=1 Tax=Actinoplanes xinjiangensis TaxID=512350 RepID=A0A316FW86_9ACTN|nr:ABC transporter ATP-binding protein [Actinoplanes xinjiangensis]PWK46307.1 hypothetical protein BC793_110301 [Actinoplanes xinjiangensis]GIF40756.1 hypothetical protein Axi01nite_50670 [Actinoplanes xinjiangensis]